MRKKVVSFISLILALCVALPPLFGVCAGAVTYPDGVSKQTVLSSLGTFDKLALKLASMNPETADLGKTVYSSLCSDKTLNSLFSAVYGSMEGNERTLTSLGIGITPQSLSATLSAYPDVSAKLAASASLSDAVEKSDTFVWGVSDKESFKTAVSRMFSPFESVLFMLLCSGSIRLNNYIAINGSDGYTSAVVPLLQALECPSIVSQADYTNNAAQNKSYMLTSVMDMLFASIDAVIAAPVQGLTGVLPHLAWYLKAGKLSASLETLMQPLSVRIGFLTIPGVSALIGGMANFENETDLSAMLSDADLSGLLGGDVNLKLPDVDLDALAACGKENSDGTFTPDRADALIVILNWLLDAVRLNAAELTKDMAAEMKAVFDKLLAKDNAALIKAVFALLSAGQSPRSKVASYTYPEQTSATVTMPEGMTVDNMLTVVTGLDKLITQFMQESDPDANIELAARKLVYSNKLAGALLTGVYGALGGDSAGGAGSLLGIPGSPAELAAYMSAYPSVARALRGASDWSKVNADNLSFGFSDGSKDGFRSAVAAILKPLEPVLSFMLAGGTLSVAGAIDVRGTNGYETAVIPLLEALGCDSQTIPSYSSFRTDGAGIIAGLIDPILAFTDRFCAAPIETVCTILPNAVYFLNSGVIPEMIKNLMYPITSLLSETGLDDVISLDVLPDMSSFSADSLLENFDLSSVLGDTGLTLPKPDLNFLAQLGTPETRVSKMSANGTSVYYTYIVADRPAVMATLLRYIFGALRSEENAGAVTEMLSSSMGGDGDSPGMFSAYIGDFTDKLSGMDTDGTIYYLYDLLFGETPKREITETEEVIPTVIYKKKSVVNAKLIILIALGVVALAFAVVWLLLRLGYLVKLQEKLDARRHRRERKKMQRDKLALQEQMAKAAMNKNVVYASQTDGAGRQGMTVSSAPPKRRQAPPAVAQNAPVARQAARPGDRPAVPTAPARDYGRGSAPQSDAPQRCEPQTDKSAYPRTEGGVPFASRAPRRPAPADEYSRQQLELYAPVKTPGASSNPIMNDRESAKLRKRQEKAAAKALRDTRKADKYYEQAIKSAKR